MAEQLSLRVNLRDEATFDNFLSGSNTQLVKTLEKMTRQQTDCFYYLWGHHGVGRTHLLQACCHQADRLHQSSLYLPLSELQAFDPSLLLDLEHQSIICLDDLDSIIGLTHWEEALFHLYNRALASTAILIFSSHCAPYELALALPDLKSRLAACLIFHMTPLTDQEKIAALQLRAKYRGFYLPDDVGLFLLRRCPRHMSDLFHCLDRLFQASLKTKKRVTLALARNILR